MSILLGRFVNWINELFSNKSARRNESSGFIKPPISFFNITTFKRTPRNTEVQPDTFYLVDPGNKPKWAMFLCPCGCEYVITLSLQNVHNPHWRLNNKVEGRPTLYPSVWQKTECYSHFWLKEGRIYWCEGSGKPPQENKGSNHES